VRHPAAVSIHPFHQRRDVEVDIEVREADAGSASEQFIVLDLCGCGLLQALEVFDGQDQTALVAQSHDEEVEILDMLDDPGLRLVVVKLCSFERRLDLGIGCDHFVLSHDASPRELQFVEVLSGYCEHMLHVRFASIAWSDGVYPVCQRHGAVASKIDNSLRIGVEAVNVARVMVHGVRGESNAVEPERAHGRSVT
jgi:hypothetical protein